MASAFSSFATNGLHADPYLIDRILDENGQVLYQHEVRQTQVIAPAIAEAARMPLLKVPTSEGTAERANIGRPQGGKTGTHQDYRDAWFVGFVPQYTTAVWVGYERDQIPLRNVTIIRRLRPSSDLGAVHEHGACQRRTG
jgi:penicillin-binding protein 1A